MAWTIDLEYARDGAEPAASVIAGGISQEETIRVVWVTDGRGIPERVLTETVGVMMVDHNGCPVRNRSILVRWVHPHNEAIDLVSSEDSDDDSSDDADDYGSDNNSDDASNDGDDNRDDESLAAFDSNIPLVNAATRNASALADYMISHGFTASEETCRDFVVAQATLTQSVVDMIDSVRVNRQALATDDWGDERMVLVLLNVLLRHRGGEKN